MRITFTILTILFCASLLVAQEPQPEKTATQLATIEPMAQAIRDYGQSPTDFIVEKFDHHDIVLLGEIHQVKENCEFVASLIEPLNKRGVKRLCSEFTPSRLNPELHRIITDKTYDESAVVDLFRLGPWPSWGYQEYMDIVRAAWQVNQNLKSDEAPFLIMGIDSDWTQVKQMKADRQARFKMLVNRESHMTESILNASIEAQEKALVHIGLAHTVKHGIRVANELDKLEQAKVFQVLLHHEIRSPSGISPIPGQIEKAAELSQRPRFGIEIAKTPLRDLQPDSLRYVKNFGDFAQGYILLKPIDQLQKVTWVEGFINETNFEDALFLAQKFGIAKDADVKTAAQLDRLYADLLRQHRK